MLPTVRMLYTCSTTFNMAKMIQIRNVPDEVHRKLKVRAARNGMTLSDMLLREATHFADTLTLEELSQRIREREPAGDIAAETIVQIIREARGPLSSE